MTPSHGRPSLLECPGRRWATVRAASSNIFAEGICRSSGASGPHGCRASVCWCHGGCSAGGLWAVQVAALVALWAAFLVLQLAKARRGRCSWGFAAAAAAQAILLAAAAAAYVVFQVCVWPW